MGEEPWPPLMTTAAHLTSQITGLCAAFDVEYQGHRDGVRLLPVATGYLQKVATHQKKLRRREWSR